MKDVEQLVKQNTVKNSVMVDKAIGYKISKKKFKEKSIETGDYQSSSSIF